MCARSMPSCVSTARSGRYAYVSIGSAPAAAGSAAVSQVREEPLALKIVRQPNKIALIGVPSAGPASTEFRRRFDLMALQRNLKALGFPIRRVVATGHVEGERSPKFTPIPPT